MFVYKWLVGDSGCMVLRHSVMFLNIDEHTVLLFYKHLGLWGLNDNLQCSTMFGHTAALYTVTPENRTDFLLILLLDTDVTGPVSFTLKVGVAY